jgi:hypothetical protein
MFFLPSTDLIDNLCHVIAASTALMLRNWRGKVVHTGGLLDMVPFFVVS